jgi:hypothetical protein
MYCSILDQNRLKNQIESANCGFGEFRRVLFAKIQLLKSIELEFDDTQIFRFGFIFIKLLYIP